jgi:hypothetical protein
MNHDNINDRVRDGAHAAGEQAKSLADTAVQAATDQAVRKVKTGRNAASDYFHSLGDAAQAGARTLEADGHPVTADQAIRCAAVLDEVGHTISDYNVEGLIADTASALRSRPALAFSLAALGGYALVKLAGNRSAHASRKGGS